MLDRVKSLAGTGAYLLVLLGLMFLSMVGLKAQASEEAKVPDMVEVLEIIGEITDLTASSVREQVKQINANKAVRAVVLVVDSPGGGVLPTSVIYEELSKIKVPVVAYCHYVCASGGTYATMAPSVKYVGVRGDTIAGSVGVIMQVTNYKQLLDKLGVSVETYKSGTLKDAGNGTRSQTEEDREYLQGIVDQLAGKFYAVVAKSRKIKDWPAVKSARIFIGEDAVKVGLADGIMSREQAIVKAKQLSGSRVIYTRDEMKEISKLANSYGTYGAPKLTVYEEGLAFLLMQAREIRRVEEVSFSYRMPLNF